MVLLCTLIPQVRSNVDLMNWPIPLPLWEDLKEQELLPRSLPAPHTE